jgi:IclR family KDG regulon transcriptional repressor
VSAVQVDPMPANSTVRVMAVIDALVRASDGTVGVRDLALQLKVSRSATHRILAALADIGVARSLDGGRYEKSAEVSAWGYFLAERHPLLTVARPLMDGLRDTVEETVHLLAATPSPTTAVFVATAKGPHPVQYTVTHGTKTSILNGAAGKALLAALEPAVSDPILSELSETDPDRARKLSAELPIIRTRGYAVSAAEFLPDTAGVAAAFHRWGRPHGSLTISMPAYRHSSDQDEERGALVKEAAAQLTAALAALEDD